MNEQPLEFSIVPQSVPIVLTGPGGVQEPYELREMISADRDKYMDLLGKRAQFNDKGEAVGVKQFEGMHSELLVRTLFKDGKPVPEKEISRLPASLTTKLYKKAQELNGLNFTKEQAEQEQANTKNA